MSASPDSVLGGSRRGDGAIGRQLRNGIHHNTENRDAVGIAVKVQFVERTQNVLRAEIGRMENVFPLEIPLNRKAAFSFLVALYVFEHNLKRLGARFASARVEEETLIVHGVDGNEAQQNTA